MKSIIKLPWRTTGYIRSSLLKISRPEYVKKSLKERRGQCNQCGYCCPVWCIHFNKKEVSCRIYKNRSSHCRSFPIDSKTLKIYGIENKCGYYWEKGEVK